MVQIHASNSLRAEIYPLKALRQKRKKYKGEEKQAVKLKADRQGMIKLFKKLSVKHRKTDLLSLAVFTRQFSMMYRAGLGIVTILDILKEQASSLPLKTALGEILSDLTGKGADIHTAFKRQKHIFSPIYLSMLAVGEKSGGTSFSIILERLADNLERQHELQNKITSALSYPAVILVIAFGVIFASAYFILPQFLPLLNSFNVEKPLPTQILLGAIKIFSNIWWTGIFIIAVYILIQLAVFFVKTPSGRILFEETILAIPVINNFVVKVHVLNFCRTVNLLYGSGIPLLDSLYSVKNVMMFEIFKGYMDELITAVKDSGEKLGMYLTVHPFFPNDFVQIIIVGEETGQLAESLNKLAALYELEMDNSLNTLVHLMEPMIMLFLGGIILFIISAIFLPFSKIASAIMN